MAVLCAPRVTASAPFARMMQPICYDFEKETQWARLPATAGALGLSPKDKTPWSVCNLGVNADFIGDWMRGYSNRIPALLHEGTRVLIYAGDADYICNCT
jgi:carboxypeptidase C (cathepsin A)